MVAATDVMVVTLAAEASVGAGGDVAAGHASSPEAQSVASGQAVPPPAAAVVSVHEWRVPTSGVCKDPPLRGISTGSVQ